MKLFSKEEVRSMHKYVKHKNEEYKNNIKNGNIIDDEYDKKIKVLNDISKIISLK